MCSYCILLPVIVGLLSALFGYLIGKSMTKPGDGTNHASLRADLEACRTNSKNLNKKIVALEHELDNLKTPGGIHFPPSESIETPMSASIVEENVAPTNVAILDASAARTALGKTVQQDDLKLIEGIGPKIAELLMAGGIKTWKDLSEASIEKCQEILKNAGERYSMHNPGTWPRQAKLMMEGKWQELKDWTNQLDGGKEK